MSVELPKRNDALRAVLASNAGTPTADTRRAVFEALLAAEALVVVLQGEVSAEGVVRVTKETPLRWSTVRASGETTLIAVFTDTDAAGELPPRAFFGTMKPAELFRAAASAGHGVMVNPAGPDYFGVLPKAIEPLSRGELPG